MRVGVQLPRPSGGRPAQIGLPKPISATEESRFREFEGVGRNMVADSSETETEFTSGSRTDDRRPVTPEVAGSSPVAPVKVLQISICM